MMGSWGIFFIMFEPKSLPVVALRRILNRVVIKKRASANSAERAAWKLTVAFPDHARALDLGAGAGVVSMAPSPHCERVVACDLTLERLEFLQRWAQHENVDNIAYVCCGERPAVRRFRFRASPVDHCDPVDVPCLD